MKNYWSCESRVTCWHLPNNRDAIGGLAIFCFSAETRAKDPLPEWVSVIITVPWVWGAQYRVNCHAIKLKVRYSGSAETDWSDHTCSSMPLTARTFFRHKLLSRYPRLHRQES